MNNKSEKSKNFAGLDLLQENINYQFKNINYLKIALNHTSFANENKKEKIITNERQEFLGDSVLSLIVSDYLFKNYDDLPEGELTKIRSALVCEKALSQFANKISLGSFLRLGRGEEINGGRKKASILADAFEALIAAIYLDSGMNFVVDFVLGFVKDYLKHVEGKFVFMDYKTLLQEIVQKNPNETLYYRIVSESGPAHNKIFKIEVLLDNNVIGRGEAGNKKDAERMAAKEALSLMGVI